MKKNSVKEGSSNMTQIYVIIVINIIIITALVIFLLYVKGFFFRSKVITVDNIYQIMNSGFLTEDERNKLVLYVMNENLSGRKIGDVLDEINGPNSKIKIYNDEKSTD